MFKVKEDPQSDLLLCCGLFRNNDESECSLNAKTSDSCFSLPGCVLFSRPSLRRLPLVLRSSGSYFDKTVSIRMRLSELTGGVAESADYRRPENKHES